MRYVKAFILGTIAVTLLAAGGAAVLAAMAGAGTIEAARVGVAPFVLASVRHADGTTETTLGAGLALAGIAGGLVNAAVLALITRRERGAPSR